VACVLQLSHILYSKSKKNDKDVSVFVNFQTAPLPVRQTGCVLYRIPIAVS